MENCINEWNRANSENIYVTNNLTFLALSYGCNISRNEFKACLYSLWKRPLQPDCF